MFECVIKQPSIPAEYCIIWLRGLGADGNDFADIVPYLNLPSTLAVRLFFLTLPFVLWRAMVVWHAELGLIYTIWTVIAWGRTGITNWWIMIQMIDQQVGAFNPRRIMLVGFSQGEQQYVAEITISISGHGVYQRICLCHEHWQHQSIQKTCLLS